MDSFEYTEYFYPNSSWIEGIYFNANTGEAVLDLNDELYLYPDVDRDEVAALAFAESPGAYYSTVFKPNFGPAEHIGNYDDVDSYKVAEVTPKNLVTTPEPEKALTTSPEPEKNFVSVGHSLGAPDSKDSGSSVQDYPTREHSLAPIGSPGVEAVDGWKTEVFFTLEGSDREYVFESALIDAGHAVEELNDYISAFGAKGKVSKVVITLG